MSFPFNRVVANCLLIAGLSLPVAQAAAAPTLNYADARHLLNRTGFGASDREVRALTGLTRAEAVERVLTASPEPLRPPSWTNDAFDSRIDSMKSEEDRAEWRRRQNQHTNELREWWLQRMVHTKAPLVEKMTLFWHNHFTTSQRKVAQAQLIWRQHELLRRNALGNFGAMLNDAAKDPAMLIYLDGANSRKGTPNENFAREVMELFTLGEGNYSETDIKEAARAFTGWSVERPTGEFIFRKGAHDDGEKTIFGQKGRFMGDDVLRILLTQPKTAEYISAKLWREFVSPVPDANEVKRVATAFRDSRYDIKTAMRTLLMSDAFWDEQNRGALIKSPVELVVGTIRTFGVEAQPILAAAATTTLLGQALYAPPNVKGWPGGELWINSASLLGRKAFTERLFRAEDMSPRAQVERAAEMLDENPMQRREARLRMLAARGVDGWRVEPDRFLAQFGESNRERNAQALVLATSPVNLKPDLKGLDWMRAVTLDPAYQVK